MRKIVLVLCLLGVSQARWLRRARSDQPKETSFVGEATGELATALFQGYIDDENNIAFSPLGYSAILAILAEGAKGETKQQLTTALHLPADEAITRKTYKFIMERLINTNQYLQNKPELKNWFYIYKNYTINDDYKKILEDYYLTDVRTVERFDPNAEHKINEKDDDKKDENIENKKPNATFNEEEEEEKEIDNVELKSEESKTEEISGLKPPKETETKLISFAVEDIPEYERPEFIKPAKNIKEKIKLVKTYPKKEQPGDEEETMLAVEARNHAKSIKTLFQNHPGSNYDTTSSLSVNSVGHRNTNGASQFNSLMIMFNGLYFKGAWKKPFDSEEEGTFYKSSTDKKVTNFMKSRGTFKTGALPGLDSVALELPYDGGRYSLLVILPRARDGISRLIADLPAVPLSDLLESLEEDVLDVCIPKFHLEITTKPVAALAKFGVSSIFSPEADLSGISSSKGLFVQEMVQHVAIWIDNSGSSTAQITTHNFAQNLKNLPEGRPIKQFSADHPFLFYILDRMDNLVVVAGKITDPKPYGM